MGAVAVGWTKGPVRGGVLNEAAAAGALPLISPVSSSRVKRLGRTRLEGPRGTQLSARVSFRRFFGRFLEPVAQTRRGVRKQKCFPHVFLTRAGGRGLRELAFPGRLLDPGRAFGPPRKTG